MDPVRYSELAGLVKRSVIFAQLRFLSASAYKLSLLVTVSSAWVGALSLYFNAAFRDVVLVHHGVPYTSYALAGAIAASLTTIIPVPITAQDMTISPIWERILGEVLFEFGLGIVKALPIALLGFGLLRPNPSLAISIPFLFILMASVSSLLSASSIVVRHENPIYWLYYGLWNLVSGLWFPIEALPFPLREISILLPQYHMVSLVRDPLIGRTPVHSLAYAVLASTFLILASRWLMIRAFRIGSLTVRFS